MACTTGAGCFLCPGYARLWKSEIDLGQDTTVFNQEGAACPLVPNAAGEVPVAAPGTIVTNPWRSLFHTVSAELAADVEDATEIRTSDTGGKRVKACDGITTWTLEVTSALCETDWLYCDILEPSPYGTCDNNPVTDPVTEPVGADAQFLNPSNGVCCWWYLGFNQDAPTGSCTDRGIYFTGASTPAGFAIDNDSSDPVTTDWTIEIADGPYMPCCNAMGALQ